MKTLHDTVELAKSANEIGYFAAALGALGVGFAQLDPASLTSWGVLACALAWGVILLLDAWTWKIMFENLESNGRVRTLNGRLLTWSAVTIAVSITSVGFLASSHPIRLWGFVCSIILYCLSIVPFWVQMRRDYERGDTEFVNTLELSWNSNFNHLYRQTMLCYPIFGALFSAALLADAMVNRSAAWWLLAGLLGLGATKYYREVVSKSGVPSTESVDLDRASVDRAERSS